MQLFNLPSIFSIRVERMPTSHPELLFQNIHWESLAYLMPDICQFWDTTTLCSPVKVHQKCIKLPKFRVLSAKKGTGLKKVHHRRWWRWWLIWGIPRIRSIIQNWHFKGNDNTYRIPKPFLQELRMSELIITALSAYSLCNINQLSPNMKHTQGLWQ